MGRGYSGNHPRFSHKQDERYDAKEAYNKDLTASARLHYLENDRHDHESPAHSHCSPMHRHTDRHIRREAKQIARKNEGDEQDIYYELKAQIDDERSQPRGNITRHIKRKPKVDDERSGEIRNQMIDEMIDDRPDSPMNQTGPDYKDKPYTRANDALKAAELDAHLIGEMKKKQDRLSQNTRFGLSGIADRTRDLARMAMDKQDLIGNVQGHMDRDIQTYPQGLGTYFDERSGGIKEAFINDPETFVKSEKEDPKRVLRFKNTPLNACAKSEGGKGCVQQMGEAWRVISNKTDKPWPAKYASKSKAEAALRGYHAG